MPKNTKSPIDLHRVLYEEYATMSVERARALISDDLVVDEASSLPVGGLYRGATGFVELMQKLVTTFPNFTFSHSDSVTDGVEKLAFHGRISGDTPNGRFEMPVVEFWRFADNKLVEVVVAWHDTKIVTDLISGARRVS